MSIPNTIMHETFIREIGKKNPDSSPRNSSLFTETRRVMLVVSKPRSACQHGTSANHSVSIIGCFGFPLSSMFSFPGRQGSKPGCAHRTGPPRQGSSLSNHMQRSFDGKWSGQESPLSSATTSASEEQASPHHTFVGDNLLPEFSAEPPQELSISGSLAETLKSVASARQNRLQSQF